MVLCPVYHDKRNIPSNILALCHSKCENIAEIQSHIQMRPIIMNELRISKYMIYPMFDYIILQWRHNGRDSVSNHQPHDCLLNRLFRRRSKKISKLRVTGLCAGNSPGTGEFPAQMASNAENVFIWWRHHATETIGCKYLSMPQCQLISVGNTK